MGLLQNLNAYLSACQLGITLASLALGWVGEPAIARLLEGPLSGLSDTLRHGIAFAVAFSIITSLHIVLGEQAPKLMGLAAAEKVALAIALPLQLFYRVFSLPIRALDWASVRTVQLLGVKATAEHASTYTEEELRKLVDISRESGHLRAEERRLIHRVFEFSDTLVREAMVPRTEMAAIPDTCNLEEITKAFDQHRYSRLPVYHESFDDVCGFIHSKDVMPYLLHPKSSGSKMCCSRRCTSSTRRDLNTFFARCRKQKCISDLSSTNTADSKASSRSKICLKNRRRDFR